MVAVKLRGRRKYVPAAADETAPDPDSWKCAQCPFLNGYDTQTEAGVLYANGVNASFGRYSGIDHSGAYVDASASGQVRTEEGTYVNYDLERLGLASREGYVEGGREGRYDLRITYDGQPRETLRHRLHSLSSQRNNALAARRLGSGRKHCRHERPQRQSCPGQNRIGPTDRRAVGALFRECELDGVWRISPSGARGYGPHVGKFLNRRCAIATAV
jgi:hypothetical protein